MEAAALQCAERLGVAGVEGAGSVGECSAGVVEQALLALLQRYEPSWLPPSTAAEVHSHVARCLNRMELGHLTRAPLTASNPALPTVLAAVYDKLQDKYGRQLNQRRSVRGRPSRVDKENLDTPAAMTAPKLPAASPQGQKNPFRTSRQLPRTPPAAARSETASSPQGRKSPASALTTSPQTRSSARSSSLGATDAAAQQANPAADPPPTAPTRSSPRRNSESKPLPPVSSTADKAKSAAPITSDDTSADTKSTAAPSMAEPRSIPTATSTTATSVPSSTTTTTTAASASTAPASVPPAAPATTAPAASNKTPSRTGKAAPSPKRSSAVHRSSPLRTSFTAPTSTQHHTGAAAQPKPDAAGIFASRSRIARTPVRAMESLDEESSSPQAATPRQQGQPPKFSLAADLTQTSEHTAASTSPQLANQKASPAVVAAPASPQIVINKAPSMTAVPGMEVTEADAAYLAHLTRVNEFFSLRDKLEELLKEAKSVQMQTEQLEATNFLIDGHVTALNADLRMCKEALGMMGKSAGSLTPRKSALPTDLEQRLEDRLSALQLHIKTVREDLTEAQDKLRNVHMQRTAATTRGKSSASPRRARAEHETRLAASIEDLENRLQQMTLSTKSLESSAKSAAARAAAEKHELEVLQSQRVYAVTQRESTSGNNENTSKRFEVLVKRTELHVERSKQLKELNDILRL